MLKCYNIYLNNDFFRVINGDQQLSYVMQDLDLNAVGFYFEIIKKLELKLKENIFTYRIIRSVNLYNLLYIIYYNILLKAIDIF